MKNQEIVNLVFEVKNIKEVPDDTFNITMNVFGTMLCDNVCNNFYQCYKSITVTSKDDDLIIEELSERDKFSVLSYINNMAKLPECDNTLSVMDIYPRFPDVVKCILSEKSRKNLDISQDMCFIMNDNDSSKVRLVTIAMTDIINEQFPSLHYSGGPIIASEGDINNAYKRNDIQ